MIIGSKFYYFDEIDSTNEYAKKIVCDSPEGTVILADNQSAGKGRLNRKWFSAEGGLYVSIILFTDKPLLLPILTAVAICETFNNYNILLGIRWPNDIMLNGKKVAGVLTEVVDRAVIVGIGINLNITQFPDDLKGIASSIFLETQKRFDKIMVYNDLCRKLDQAYILLKDNKTTELLQKWRNYTIMLEKTVEIETPNQVITGRVIDIANNGALVITLPDGQITKVLAGDCKIVKKIK